MKPTNDETSTGDIAPVQSPEVKTWKEFSRAINAQWRKSVDAILQTARYCSLADERLSCADWESLQATLPFDNTALCKLSKIGSDTRLYDPTVRALLPPNYSIILEVHHLNDEQLKNAVESGKLHPEARRKDVQALRTKRAYKRRARLPLDDPQATSQPSLAAAVVGDGGAVKRSEIAKPVVLGEIRIAASYPEERREQLQKELMHLALAFDCTFIPKLTPDERALGKYERDLTRYFERCLAEGRKLARRRIKRLKNQRLLRGGKWGFAEDETTIDRFAGWDEISSVLDFIGIGDEFGELKRTAEQNIPMPDAPDVKGQEVPFDPKVVTLGPTLPKISARKLAGLH